MNYVILDMEWDSAYFPPQKRFINQILQIGAVKLDENFNILGTFESTVRSSFSKRVSKRFTTLTGITKQMMLSGDKIEDAVSNFNEFIGDNSVVMTWSTSDLYTIIENEKNIIKGVKFKIEKYLDLQKFVQGELRLLGYEDKSQISLEHAAEILKVKTENFYLHTAKDDSVLSGLLLKSCYNEERFTALIKDTSNPEFFNRLQFKAHFIDKIDSPDIPKNSFDFVCPLCNGEIIQKKKWHYHNRNFNAEFFCTNCQKKLIARVSARKTYDDVVIKKKILPKKERPVQNNDMQPMSEKL